MSRKGEEPAGRWCAKVGQRKAVCEEERKGAAGDERKGREAAAAGEKREERRQAIN